MTLLVRTPGTYLEERRYVLGVVFSEWLGLEYALIVDDTRHVTVCVEGDPSGSELLVPDVLFATPAPDWLTQRSMPVRPLAQVTVPVHRSLGPASGALDAVAMPIIYGTPPADGLAWRRTPEGASLSIDVFGSAFYCLTRYEEVINRIGDPHGRFPASASLAAAEGFLRRPLVDEYVGLLWAAMQSLWPTLRRRSDRFRLSLTHDVDQPWAALGQSQAAIVHALAGDLVRRRDPVLAARRARAFLDAQVGRVDRDPLNTFDFLMDTSERVGLRSTFYFLTKNSAGTSATRLRLGDIDGSYRLSDPQIKELLRRVHVRGHEVGLHASYDSYLSTEQTGRELQSLIEGCHAAGFDQPAWGVRQHYLRFQNPQTWRNHEHAGLSHDSTVGFADDVGFRAGTCREYQAFDLGEHRSLRLRERPLIVMDVTLFEYLALGLNEAAALARTIVASCRRAQGSAVVLYHNSSLAGDRDRAHYRELVEDLVRPG